MTEPTEERPLVTFALFAYNQERFIREAVEGALAQTYSPLQVILSDDCSSDRTFEIMQEMVAEYSGPHEILLNRNERNLGVGGHVNRVMELAQGELIVMAAGDDISLPQRTRVLVDTWIKASKPLGSIHSAVEILSYSSTVSGTVVHGSSKFPEQTIIQCIRTGAIGILGATVAVTHKLFDLFGPLPEGVLFEDRIIAFRSLLAGTAIYCPEVLVKYRRHQENITGNEIYSDALRWSRWIDGVIINYQSFLIDYKLYMSGKFLDRTVFSEIDKGIRRAEYSRKLVTGSPIDRARAAFYCSRNFNISYRVAFVLQHAGIKDTIFYRFLSVTKRFFQSMTCTEIT